MSNNVKKPSILEETLTSIRDVKESLLENTNNAFKGTSLREELERVLSEETDVTVNEAKEDGEEENAIGSTEDMGSELTTDTPDLDASEEGIEEPESVEATDNIPTDVPAVDDTEIVDLTNSSDEEALNVFKKLGPEDEIEVVQNNNGEIEITTQDGSEFVAKPNDGEETPEVGAPEVGDVAVDADVSDIAVYAPTADGTIGDDGLEGGEIETVDGEEPLTSDEDEEEEIVFEFDLNEVNEEETVAEETVTEEEEVAEETVAEESVNENVNWKAKYDKLMESNTKVTTELKGFRGKYASLVKEQNVLNNTLTTLNENVKGYKVNESEYEKSLSSVMRTLKEVAVYTANTTNIMKLMMENSTTSDEKANILKRFDGVASVNESKRVYDTLNENFKSINKKTAEQILSESTRSQQSGTSATTSLKEKQLFKDKSINEAVEKMVTIINYNS